jgi:hypothetical protein
MCVSRNVLVRDVEWAKPTGDISMYMGGVVGGMHVR